MKKRILLDKIHRLLTPESPHKLKIYIDGTPDLKWILTSKKTPQEINEQIRATTVPLRLYKEFPYPEDLVVVAASEAGAETLIEVFLKQ